MSLLLALPARRTYLSLSAESVRSLDRLIAAAAPKMETLLQGLELSAVQSPLIKVKLDLFHTLTAQAGDAGGRRRLEEFRSICFDVLTPEQVGAMLRAANPELFKEPDAGAKP